MFVPITQHMYANSGHSLCFMYLKISRTVTYVLGLSYSCVTLVLRLRYACVTLALRLRYACVTLALHLGYTWVTLGIHKYKTQSSVASLSSV